MLARTTGVAVAMAAVTVLGSGVSSADPDQDQRFLDLLSAEHAPAVENVPEIIAVGHQICTRLDAGTPFDVLRDSLAEKSMGARPEERSTPARVSLAMTRAITASVEVYCPQHRDLLPR